MDRGDIGAQSGKVRMERSLLQAAHAAGVPVPAVVAMGVGDDLGADWLVVERLEGETIPRKILRDAEWAGARRALTAQCGRALAAIHTIAPGSVDGLPAADPLGDPLPFLDALGEARPALELGVRWLDRHRPAPGPRVTVHGDFRCGNFLVGPEGLRGVLDWELAHAGDPAEDIGWLCAPAWRFGGHGEVGGFGTLDELLGVVRRGRRRGDGPRPGALVAGARHGEVGRHLLPAGLRAPQWRDPVRGAGRHRPPRLRERVGSLHAAGRGPGDPAPEPAARGNPVAPFGRPTAAELVEAVREYLETNVMERSDGGARFEARVARNALGIVERELVYGRDVAAAHAYRLRDLGISDDAALAAAIRAGDFDDGWEPVAAALAASARDQLLVANPSYLPAASA